MWKGRRWAWTFQPGMCSFLCGFWPGVQGDDTPLSVVISRQGMPSGPGGPSVPYLPTGNSRPSAFAPYTSSACSGSAGTEPWLLRAMLLLPFHLRPRSSRRVWPVKPWDLHPVLRVSSSIFSTPPRCQLCLLWLSILAGGRSQLGPRPLPSSSCSSPGCSLL